jgi:anti-anti-sigma factor
MSDPMRPPGFSIEALEAGDSAVRFALSGELDITSASELEQVVKARLVAEAPAGLVLDLGELTFVDSTGLRAIVAVVDACKEHGCDLAILPGTRAVQRLFELTGLIDVLPFRAAEPDGTQR